MEPTALDPAAPFDELSTPRRVERDLFVASVPDGWQQGRGAFGGLVIALMVRAAEATVPAGGRTLRSLTAELCGPTVPGPVEVRVETLRETKNVTTVAVRLAQAGVVQAHSVCVLGSARATAGDRAWLDAPQLPPWREVQPMGEMPLAPAFSRFFEYRISTPLPAAGAAEPRAEGWIRPRRPGGKRDAAFLVACADAWFPSFFACEPPRPVGTISFTFDVAGSLDGLDPTVPLAYRARTLSVREGWAVEHRELWTENGLLLALNHQTFVIIR
ncbi:MAG: thioesterase family protein [Deltaproteobacteria bacterium]|nr:thioesterase family protein [Deltaproteobacteria bacterium]